MVLWSKTQIALLEGPGFTPSTPQGSSQLPVTPVYGDLMPSTSFHGQ